MVQVFRALGALLKKLLLAPLLLLRWLIVTIAEKAVGCLVALVLFILLLYLLALLLQ